MIQDRDYLGLTLIGEARGEPIEGIVGVGFAIRNRVYAARKLYKDICLAPLQFSCWNDNDPNFKLIQKVMSDLDNGNVINDPYLRQCIAAGKAIYENDFVDNVKGAKNYVTVTRHQEAVIRQNSKLDGWIIKMKPVVTLGNHIFLVD